MSSLNEQLMAGIKQHSDAAHFYRTEGEAIERSRQQMLSSAGAKEVALQKQVDGFISDHARQLLAPMIGYYDGEVYAKNSLSLKADPNDASRTQWLPVPNSEPFHFYPSEGHLTLVDTRRAYSYVPGHYEKPPYSKDYCRSFMQFVYANDSATSTEINDRLAAIKQTPDNAGGWWDGTRVIKAVAVRVSGKHPYSRLFVRYVNVIASSTHRDKPVQAILEYGGNSSFAIDRVRHYPHIKNS